MTQYILEMPHVFMSFKNVTGVLERADSENQIGLYLNPSCDGCVALENLLFTSCVALENLFSEFLGFFICKVALISISWGCHID